MPDWNLLAAILVMALATVATRALPFMVLYKVSHHPLLQYLGRYLPPMIMMLLVLYALKDSMAIRIEFLPHCAGVGSVVALHLLWRQPLISIVGGTAVYMLGLHLIA